MYYLVIIQNDTTPAIYSYTTYEDALSRYHTELAYRSDERISTRCAIFDRNMTMMRSEVYSKQIETEETH